MPLACQELLRRSIAKRAPWPFRLLNRHLLHRQWNPSRISLGSMQQVIESAHFRAQNRSDTVARNALAKQRGARHPEAVGVILPPPQQTGSLYPTPAHPHRQPRNRAADRIAGQAAGIGATLGPAGGAAFAQKARKPAWPLGRGHGRGIGQSGDLRAMRLAGCGQSLRHLRRSAPRSQHVVRGG